MLSSKIFTQLLPFYREATLMLLTTPTIYFSPPRHPLYNRPPNLPSHQQIHTHQSPQVLLQFAHILPWQLLTPLSHPLPPCSTPFLVPVSYTSFPPATSPRFPLADAHTNDHASLPCPHIPPSPVLQCSREDSLFKCTGSTFCLRFTSNN
jgi:hypothetical protein